ncbi:CYTH domain-containing protein [Neobacillus sp. LXY-4]|uniref:CYTH domain-containing protein n=1 Tax=Neobacillus sp. LXY-4 TaxID=3379826 RepID=UPI003EDF9CEE
MSQQIEIEFKNLLTKEEYDCLKEFFKIDDEQIKKQINHYFDTPIFNLKEVHSALRIREKGNQWEMTLKQPAEVGLLETNQLLTLNEKDAMLNHGTIPNGPVKTLLASAGIPYQDIEYFGSLTTYRIEFEYEGGLLVLDHSFYLNLEDYEIEYEVSDPDSGQQLFHKLLNSLQIPTRKTENKVQRFYRQKYLQG